MSDPQPILERLLHLHPKLIDLQLDRVWKLLGELGAPHLKMPPVVHVAGTNGKGSVIAMMRAALEAAGYKVHVYTSPHLVRFNERIRLAGRLIEDDELTEVLEICERTNNNRPITFFEITTAAAFLAFSRRPADVTLLETGLGGRLDATNAIRNAVLTAITPVSMDHQQHLGDTLSMIAGEKAGILKKGVPCVTALQPRDAENAITEKAAAVSAPLVIEGLDWTVRHGPEGIVINAGGHIREFPLPSLEGPHQAQNAGLAVALLDRLPGFTLADGQIAAGLKNTEWPARLQRLRRGPIRGALGPEFALWLDGGHNPGAADALAAWLAQREPLPLHLVFGMLNTKDPEGFLRPLVPYVHSVYSVPIKGQENCCSSAELARVATGLGLTATACDDVRGALRAIRANEIGPARVLIAGSLYLAGTVLAENG
ncbi:MAG: bifunctional folylpolyglutamate synthase/dihydrofolate synthase [Rhodospirillales bacterium]|nr:bifunctional folylpolyglutamate synthase/dihydrofolate synthase [Rhodospirillales bacterium]